MSPTIAHELLDNIITLRTQLETLEEKWQAEVNERLKQTAILQQIDAEVGKKLAEKDRLIETLREQIADLRNEIIVWKGIKEGYVRSD